MIKLRLITRGNKIVIEIACFADIDRACQRLFIRITDETSWNHFYAKYIQRHLDIN